jgi:hypothetical protein
MPTKFALIRLAKGERMYKKAGKSLSRKGTGLSWQANPVKARPKAKRRVNAKGRVKATRPAPGPARGRFISSPKAKEPRLGIKL